MSRASRRAERVVEQAIRAWTECDWSHEATDLMGNLLRDDRARPVECGGGEPQRCGYCRDALADAEAAQALGEEALDALREGDLASALRGCRAAAALERDWGDAPAWDPAVRACAAALEVAP